MAKTAIRIAALVAIAIGFIGAGWWWMREPAEPAPLALEGNVEIRQVNLGFKVAGRIASVEVDEGATVHAGQQLAKLEKVYFEAAIAQLTAQRDQLKANLDKLEAGNRPEEVAQAEAAVAEREAALTNAKLALDRAKTLLDTSTGTRKAYDDALAGDRQASAQLNSARQALLLMKAGFRREDIEAARAQLAGADAALRIAELQLSDAVLVAPNAGVILTRVRETGAIVNPAETVLVLSLTTPVWVRTYVSEIDLARIKPGQRVVVTTDAPSVPPMTGHVGFISTTAEFTPKTVETRELRTALVYRVRIVVEDPRGVLRQGMPVSVRAAENAADASTHLSERRS